MLIEAGLLDKNQLAEALALSRKSSEKIGQILVQQGVITDPVLVDHLARQLRVPRYKTEMHSQDASLSKTIPTETAQKHQLVPLTKKGNLLTIAMTDPLDVAALDDIESMTNCEVDPVICTAEELTQIMQSLYGVYSGLDEVLEDIRQAGQEEKDSPLEPHSEDVEMSSLENMAQDAPIIRLVNSVLTQAIQEGASDIHISPEKEYIQVRLRVDGKLHEIPAPPKSLFLPIVSRLKVLANMDISHSRIPQDGRFTVHIQEKEVNIRTSTIPTIYGENVVMRLLDMSTGVYSLEQLGMSRGDMAKIRSMIVKPFGMILSTGPTGSGKTTSLYSILKELNTPDINIITLEDPVEYRVENIRQVQLNKKAGMTFASGLRSILRQDPDVIMVGEIRDPETATIAVQAALTGHRVLSTVHTNDAPGAITRFLDMGIEPFLVSSVMLVSFAQRLIRKVCPQCKESYQPPREALLEWGLEKVKEARYRRGKGCINCMQTGFKGRTGIFEVLVIDEMIQDMIVKKNSAQEIARAARKAKKLRTLKQDAAGKAIRGITTLEEAAHAVMSF
ncbi:MAG: Flp pilus assembly complex ATPase component TadA [Deltaproteobacteria bacterium]|nr:Flp pilus assembly complex ATPase component TadA [Deltaproteobacteria bacterium]